MVEDTAHKLEQLIGETKMYNGKKITISSFKEVGQTIVIKTNSRTITLLPSEIDLFFIDLKDVEPGSTRNLPDTNNNDKGIIINGYEPSAENITIKTTLMDVLKELNNGATDEKIKKARSICDVANTMVNIQKAEIQLINAVKK